MTGLLADRYRVLAPLEPIGGVPRDLAVDVATEGRVELARFAAGGAVPAAFEDLARRYAACHHACLSPVLDVVVPPAGEGSPIVVEGHADGPRLAPAETLPRQVALRVAADVADALAALHAAALVHGALGPEAVVLDPAGRPRVMGAGSRRLQATALASAEPVGSVDDDVRALGRIVYALICGRLPDPVPVAPASIAADVDPTLNGLILAILSDDPLRPPPPAGAVALRLRDLAAVGMNAVVPPGPPGPPPTYRAYAPAEPLRSLPRRGYSDAGLIGAAVVLAVSGVLAAYAFSSLDDDAEPDTVTSIQVRTVARVVPVPVGGGSTVPTNTEGIFTVPTDTTAAAESFPLTLTDIVTQTDPFVIPTVITATETVTVTEAETLTDLTTELTDTELTDTELTDTELTDTELTDTELTDTSGTNTG